MKQRTISCPFCNKEMLAIEGISIPCLNCKHDVVIEKEVTDSIEDQLYFLASSPKEKAQYLMNFGRDLSDNQEKYEDAYRFLCAAKNLDSTNDTIEVVYASSYLEYLMMVKKNFSKDTKNEVEQLYLKVRDKQVEENELSKLNVLYNEFIKVYIEEEKKSPAKNNTHQSKTKKKISKKDCLSSPEPIKFPGLSGNKIIKASFWTLVVSTVLFLFYSYMAFFNPDLLGNKEAFESNPLSISLLIALLGVIGLLLTIVWIGYYLVRLLHGVDNSEPNSFTIIRRVSLIVLLVSVVSCIWNAGLLLIMNNVPVELLEGVDMFLNSTEEVMAFKISGVAVVSLIAFLYVFHIVNHTRMMSFNNGRSTKLIIGEASGVIEFTSFWILVLTGVYYLVNWLWKSVIEFITFGYYTQVSSIMFWVLICSIITFVITFIIDCSTAQK